MLDNLCSLMCDKRLIKDRKTTDISRELRENYASAMLLLQYMTIVHLTTWRLERCLDNLREKDIGNIVDCTQMSDVCGMSKRSHTIWHVARPFVENESRLINHRVHQCRCQQLEEWAGLHSTCCNSWSAVILIVNQT